MDLQTAFSKVQPAKVEEAKVVIDQAGTCPVCKTTMKKVFSSRDIPTFWCNDCQVALPANNSLFPASQL